MSDDLVRLADAHWVAPLLAHRALDARSPAVARSLVPILRRHLCFEASFELLTRREIAAVATALADAGVPMLIMKGAALAYTHYPAPHLRPRLDTDVLIDTAHRQRVGEVLIARGFERSASVGGDVIAHQDQYVTRLRGGLVHAIDVHWKIANPAAFADLFTLSDLRRTAVPLAPFGPHAWTTAPPETLILLAVHRMAHHERDVDLLCLFDLHAVAQRMSAAEWDRVRSLSEERSLSEIVAEALRTAFALIPTDVTDDVRQWIAHHAARPVPPRFAAFARRDRSVADVMWSDLALARGWRARVRLLRAHVLPPASYMRARFSGGRVWALPFLYAWRVVAGVPRAFVRGRFR